jgi:hypothetical protein
MYVTFVDFLLFIVFETHLHFFIWDECDKKKELFYYKNKKKIYIQKKKQNAECNALDINWISTCSYIIKINFIDYENRKLT